MTTYDGIILGAGHNGLILQAYLGKAGLKTLAIERRAAPGGGLSTIEDPRRRGFLHNTHAFFLRAVTAMPWYADLELARRGAQLIEPELNVALITSEGRALEWWTDIGKTIDSFSAFSRRDAASLRRWHDEFVPIVAQILTPEARSPPLPPQERRALLSRTPAGRRLLAVSALSPLEFVEREFEHPTIKAGLLFFNGLREVDLRLPGFGHHIAALLASPAKGRWRAAARRRSRARSRPRCAKPAARSGSTRSPRASSSTAVEQSASKPVTANSSARSTSSPPR